MKRAFVFLLVAPVFAAIAVALLLIGASGLGARQFAAPLAMAALIFTFLVSALACGLDAWLARHVFVVPRAGLTAGGGAIVAGGLTSFMIGCVLPPAAVVVAAICGGISTGICSLLANDFSARREAAAFSASPQQAV